MQQGKHQSQPSRPESRPLRVISEIGITALVLTYPIFATMFQSPLLFQSNPNFSTTTHLQHVTPLAHSSSSEASNALMLCQELCHVHPKLGQATLSLH